jgi:alkylation response protein AidB-like acyl-CoA dehydrogenase
VSIVPATTLAPILASATAALAVSRAYAASLASGVIERDRAGSVPRADLAALDASGLLGITVPAAHGGPDLSPVALAEVIRTIAAVDPAIAQVPQAHFLFVDALATLGSAAQQRRLFADVLAGARLGNGMAERGGQHAQDLKARLRRTPAGLRLDGRKYYCTGAISARWIGVTALDEAGRLVLAFVERGAQAKAFASETAVAVASDLFALTGASAADERYDLSRHWRNARTHASRDPADWKRPVDDHRLNSLVGLISELGTACNLARNAQ